MGRGEFFAGTAEGVVKFVAQEGGGVIILRAGGGREVSPAPLGNGIVGRGYLLI